MIFSSDLRELTTPQHNILVDNNGAACISEYGLEIVLRDMAPSELTQTNIRWMAPEILGTGGRRIQSGDGGKAADVYSFAMIMFEVCLPRIYPTVHPDISPPTSGPDWYHPVLGPK